MDTKDFYDKLKGVIYGQAIGDALGLGAEGMKSKDMASNYPQGLQHFGQIIQDKYRKRWNIGEWTDDTDMMLCIANAFIEDKRVDYKNIAKYFKQWINSDPLGQGSHTCMVLKNEDYKDKPFEVSKYVWEKKECKCASNGGLMRTSVVGLFPETITAHAENICRLTHYDPRCVGSCVIVSELIHALVYDEHIPSVSNILDMAGNYDSRIAEYVKKAWQEENVNRLMDDSNMAYTLLTLSIALWAFWHTESFEDGLLKVVNAGGDADTNAAVACSLLGAKFGFHTIPEEYVKGLMHREQIDDVITKLSSILCK